MWTIANFGYTTNSPPPPPTKIPKHNLKTLFGCNFALLRCCCYCSLGVLFLLSAPFVTAVAGGDGAHQQLWWWARISAEAEAIMKTKRTGPTPPLFLESSVLFVFTVLLFASHHHL
jgi:hypothetical protein